MTAGSFEKASPHDVHMTGRKKKRSCIVLETDQRCLKGGVAVMTAPTESQIESIKIKTRPKLYTM